jgi:hypothetical protein
MTTPRVVELPRRLESTSNDTFLGGCASDAPLAAVVQLRPRTGLRSVRSQPVRRGGRPLRSVPTAGPGDQAA